MSVLKLARPELLGRAGYQAAIGNFDVVRLHANELPDLSTGSSNADKNSTQRSDIAVNQPTGTAPEYSFATDTPQIGSDEASLKNTQHSDLNRYPPPRPFELMQVVADQLEVEQGNILITRGSNEAIDLLVRAFCRSGKDKIIICPPTFGMYEVCAQVQDAGCIRVPLTANFELDINAIDEAVTDTVKIVFVCSPGNPTGKSIATSTLNQLCERLAGRALIAIDQAYIEFATSDAPVSLIRQHANVVVLRTFSKAFGLAGLRCGMAIGNSEVVALLDSLLPPYAIPTPTIDGVIQALSPLGMKRMKKNLQQIQHEKNRVTEFLNGYTNAQKIYPSDANFLLVKFNNANEIYQQLLNDGILVRRFDRTPDLAGCLRVTIGNADENDQLIRSLGGVCS